MHRKYTAVDFDDDLRTVLRRSGCRGEKIVFILDESNMLDSSFLERMNTLLANGEVSRDIEGVARGGDGQTISMVFQALSFLICHGGRELRKKFLPIHSEV